MLCHYDEIGLLKPAEIDRFHIDGTAKFESRRVREKIRQEQQNVENPDVFSCSYSL